MLRLRHSARLVGDLFAYSMVNRTWWLAPLVLILLGLTLVAAVGQAAVPYTMYTLF